jgi:hypothetical protein
VNNDDDSETVVARHETMAMMAVHLPRIQNLVVGGAPPPPSWACPFGGPGAVRLSFQDDAADILAKDDGELSE